MWGKMFKLGCIVPSLTDGTSFYRAAGPLQALELQFPNRVKLEMSGTINWVYMRGVNGVFLQRPYGSDHLKIMNLARMNGKPTWVDYDDDLYSVPMQNPMHKVYSSRAIQNSITSIITQADFVSVSTQALKEKFARILERVASAPENRDLLSRHFSPDKITVIPNAYDEKLFDYSYRHWCKPGEPANLTALWRGSHTHDADMNEYTIPLTKAFSNHGAKWTLNFVGSPFWGTIRYLENAGVSSDQIIVTPPLDPIEYFHYLHHIRPAFVFVPLLKDPFNLSKSNIGWIEATHAGAVCVAPDWPEWRRPGIINYCDQDDFQNKIENLLNFKFQREDLLRKSEAYISRYLTLSEVNRQRLDIIEKMNRIDAWQ
jgi:glycosyltransferase involved in cell wall biosynthesis